MFDVIVIGAGVAGMTSALYLLRAKKTVLILEAENFGGQIASSPLVENYPGVPSASGLTIVNSLFDQVQTMGAEIELERVIGIKDLGDKKQVVTEYGIHEASAVIIATGVTYRKLGLEREDELAGNGVSYCCVCDGPFFKDKKVVVSGGGNSALQQAIYLAEFCQKVYLIHRSGEFKAEESLIEKVKENKKIETIMETQIVELEGEKKLEGLKLKDRKSGEERELAVDGLFVAIGRTPNNEAFRSLGILDEAGFVETDEGCKTKVENVFAAGDCRAKKVRQLTTATADGTVAALGVG